MRQCLARTPAVRARWQACLFPFEDPGIDWRIRFFWGVPVILFEPSTPPSRLRPWSGRSSQAVESGICAGATYPSRRRCFVHSAVSLRRPQPGPRGLDEYIFFAHF